MPGTPDAQRYSQRPDPVPPPYGNSILAPRSQNSTCRAWRAPLPGVRPSSWPVSTDARPARDRTSSLAISPRSCAKPCTKRSISRTAPVPAPLAKANSVSARGKYESILPPRLSTAYAMMLADRTWQSSGGWSFSLNQRSPPRL